MTNWHLPVNSCMTDFTRDFLFTKTWRVLGHYRSTDGRMASRVQDVLDTMKRVHQFQTRVEVLDYISQGLFGEGGAEAPKNIVYIWIGDKLYVGSRFSVFRVFLDSMRNAMAPVLVCACARRLFSGFWGRGVGSVSRRFLGQVLKCSTTKWRHKAATQGYKTTRRRS
jgi:hypothetical protein